MSRITPAMSDGRSFTNYVSSGIYNTFIERKFSIDDDTEYRRYLQEHADKILKFSNQVRVVDIQPAGAPGPVHPYHQSGSYAQAFAPYKPVTRF